ncbi:putative sterigmatocystin biosynthesis peroxidase stcC [Grifola frondosa]|uniref:Putative sterigmatocystin biosynthesis peroxidase stcC n=1 Tax=Grifola frondosa TaxID=5627 RepID=A0A1C7MI62_GRIFR|nr:putative sterigmatocystin biosynthesis peroxidase stcC [Grifola frondosa]
MLHVFLRPDAKVCIKEGQGIASLIDPTTMADSFLVTAFERILLGLVSSFVDALTNVGVLVWDISLTLYNVVAPNRPANHVVPAGYPGAGGLWPQYVAPEEGDSRCSCPALNAMANHGILPHSGRGISFREMNAAIRATYNFAPTFCFFVPHYAANFLNRSYWTGTFDLGDLDAHNCIEHDASLTRDDQHVAGDQAKPCVPLIEELLASASGPGGDLTTADLSRFSGKRRVQAQQRNPRFTLAFPHKLFSSSNSSTMLTIFGGKSKDLRTVLLEERIPEGWQPRIRHPMGLTMTAFQLTVLRVELGIREEVDGSFAGWSALKGGKKAGERPKL